MFVGNQVLQVSFFFGFVLQGQGHGAHSRVPRCPHLLSPGVRVALAGDTPPLLSILYLIFSKDVMKCLGTWSAQKQGFFPPHLTKGERN